MAGLGLSMGAIDTRLFSVVVIMSIATTVVVPPLLKLLYRPPPTPIGEDGAMAPAGDERAGEG